MSAFVNNTVDHKKGEYVVRCKFGSRIETFPSMMDCQKWLTLMKKSGKIESIMIHLHDVLVTAKYQTAYDTSFAY